LDSEEIDVRYSGLNVVKNKIFTVSAYGVTDTAELGIGQYFRRLPYFSEIQKQYLTKPLPGSLDKKGGRRFHLL
jgi:hypothetical protein